MVLTSTYTYYVIRVDASTIQLASSYSNAQSATYIDFTSAGVGTKHTLTMTSGAADAVAVLGTGGEIVGYTITNTGLTSFTLDYVSNGVSHNLGDYVVFGGTPQTLYQNLLNAEQNRTINMKDVMMFVRDKHTFINRVNTIIQFL